MMPSMLLDNTAIMARPPLALVFWALWFSLFSLTRAEDKPCTGRHNGKYYDLNPLQLGKDFTSKTPEGHEMVLSVCKSVSHETWRLNVQDPGLVGGFVRLGHGDFSMGQTSTTLSFSGRAGHPHLTLSSGSKCRDSNGDTIENMKGSTEIEFVCDPAAKRGTPRLVAQLPPGGDDAACAWVFEWRTAAACPTSEGVTFGGVIWFLFISALILLATYLVIGTLYNYFVLGLNSSLTDALPRFSVAGMLYHGREAWGMAGEWAAGGFGRGGPRGPVGLGGPGGFRTARDPESRGRTFGTADDDGSMNSSANGSASPNVHVTNNTPNVNANPFIRTKTSVRTEMNPASHQTQVMSGAPVPSPGALKEMSAPSPVGVGAAAPGQGQGVEQALAAGLNPASHQAQVMSGMPVPHLSSPSRMTAPPPMVQPTPPAPAPALGRRETGQTFAVGDMDDENDEEDATEIQIADVRGRMDAGEGGEGIIRL
ncbi:PLCXc domain-containing protein [Mycena sanguinolenta]|uniref:PLCXc domain-containing protein n=1 Tax=Mycena sanguinolenta TaxID=230812 RepID=A0A8H7D4A9_9AGAR|nr:PLCXc domain-containing protein [Mycena sanguinolenta]